MAERPTRTRTPDELDRALRELFAANETWRLLDVVQQAYGWFDGACWDVAAALHEWLDRGELMLLAGRDGVVHHVVLRAGSLYLDADGATDERRLLGRWQHRERVAAPRLLAFDQAAAAGLPRSEPLRRALVECLTRHLDADNARIMLDKRIRA